MDPKTLAELSVLVQQLPHDQIMRMQSLMHNMMAGFDVRKEMEEFERALPPSFREKLVAIVGARTFPPVAPTSTPGEEMDVREARLTLLRAVAEGKMSPEDAEAMLFPA